MKKLLIRSKSETDWFRDKENLDIININLKKFKKTKVDENNTNKPDTSNFSRTLNTKNNNAPNLNLNKSKTLKQKQRISLFEVTKQDLQNKNNIISKPEEKESEVQNTNKKGVFYENNFQDYLKKIIKFKLQFDRKFFDKEIETNKNFLDINLEIILNILRNFKEKQLERLNLENLENNNNFSLSIESEDSSMDSPELSGSNESAKANKRKLSRFKESEENENFIDNLEKFEQIVEILIKTSPEDLFREVKSIILNEYESTVNQIKHYLEQNKNESTKKFLTCISANILFIISTITYKLDYYTITVNCLVEKLNKFFTFFVDCTKDSDKYVKSLDLVQKFVKIKKTFMKDFIDNRQKIPEESLENSASIGSSVIIGSGKENSVSAIAANENFSVNVNEKILYNFAFNKFCSFGRYFFNNIFSLLDFNVFIDPDYLNKTGINYERLKDEFGCIVNVYKNKIKNRQGKNFFLWKKRLGKFEIQKIKLTLDKYFRMFFNSKLASWKYSMIQPGIKKIEICRICETTFEINEFVLHLFFCKEIRMNNQSLIEIKHEMKKAVERLKAYRESLLKDKANLKDIFFSPKSEFNQIYRFHVLERTPQILNKMKLESNQNSNHFLFNKLGEKANLISQNKNLSLSSNSEVEFLDKIIQTYSKERDLSREYYEKFPYKLSQLISIVHFTIYIFFQNKNSPKYNQDLNEIFAKLFVLTMKKLNLIENILSLNNSKENARMKIRNNTKNKSKPAENDNKVFIEDHKEAEINKKENKVVSEFIDQLATDDNKIKNNIEPTKETSKKNVRNLYKNFIDIERPNKDLNKINIMASRNDKNNEIKENNNIKGTNYLAKFTTMRSGQIPNVPVTLKEKEKEKEKEKQFSEKKEIDTIITNSCKIDNEDDSENKMNENNNIDEKINEKIDEELKKAEEHNDEKLISRAYCGPYLKTRTIKSSQEAFQSTFRKKTDFLSLIKEKDELKPELLENQATQINSESKNREGDSKSKDASKASYSTLNLKGLQAAEKDKLDKKAENYALRVSAQFTNLPRTTRTLKKDSLKDFCDMLDLTKSKLQTRRVLNKNDSNLNANPSKNYLQALASRKQNTESVLANSGEAAKNLAASRKNIVKLVSSELKNLTKLSKIDDGISSLNKNYFLHANTVSGNTAENPLENNGAGFNNNVETNNINTATAFTTVNLNSKDIYSTGDFNNFKTNTNCTNINVNLNKLSSPISIEYYRAKSSKLKVENKSLTADDMENSNSGLMNTNNTNSTNTNNLTYMFLNNTAINANLLLTPVNTTTKNNSILKRSLFDKTPSPNYVLRNEKFFNNMKKESEKLLLGEGSNKNFSESILNQELEKLNIISEKKLNYHKYKTGADDNYFSPTDSNNSYQLRKPQSMEFSANSNTNFENKLNMNQISNFARNNNNINNVNFNNLQSNLTPIESITSKHFSFRKFNSFKLENYDIRNEIFANPTNINLIYNKNSSEELADEYYTGSIKFLPEEKPSQKSVNSEFDMQLKNLDSELSLNVNKFPLSNYQSGKSLTPNLRQSSSNLGIDSSIDSEITFNQNSDSRRLNREESLVNEINDEVDSQFDEMIELMDDIQLSDPYREIENEQSPSETKPNTIKISDFKLISEISKGGYGRVDLYKKISTGDIYAIKTVDIKKMKSKNISGLLKNEALIMNEIYSDYVVKCYYIFNDDKNYYYVMEYMSGGDLHHFLSEYSLGFETIQFIIAEVILALEYLHSKNIIHRDMKPENIVISSNGHFKLTDFGISEIGLLHNKYAITNKINPESENAKEDKWVDSGKILGTQNYMAPEVIKCEKITYKTDYWSVGVILYELFANKTPFYNGNLEEVFDNILNLKIDWENFDREVEDEKIREIARDLISKFLVLDPAKRWGDTNINEVKAHKFFETFDWANVKTMKNLLVLKHVAEKIKQSKQIKIIAANALKKINEEDENKNSNKFANKEENREKNQSGKIEGQKNSQRNTDNKEKDSDNYNSNKDKDEFNLFYSERIDNLNKKNEDVLKTNIKLKKIEIDTDDVNFTNLMHDLD